jgi:GGDEF domain-containing protein
LRCLFLFCVLLAPVSLQAKPTRADSLAILSDLRLAVLQAEDKVPLADILGNRAKVGFDPVLRRGRTVVADPSGTIWLRVRADVLADSGKLYLAVPRQAIDSIRLYTADSLQRPLALTGIGHEGDPVRWPDAFVLPMPAGDSSGTSTAYLAIKGRGLLNLQVELLDEARMQEAQGHASSIYTLLYGSLLLVGLLAMVRRWTHAEPGYRLAQAAFATLAASMVDAYHLQLSIGGAPLTSRPNLPVALWILACAALLRATQQFAGHEQNSPAGARLVERGAWAVAALALLALFVPASFLAQSQVIGYLVMLATAVACCVSLFLDPRHWRWTMLLVWVGVLVALLALPLAWAQAMPETMLARRGFQVLLALLLATYLVLPWVRQSLRTRAAARRAMVPQASVEEKIADAREFLMNSLQAGMESAAEADMEWIAYRRLMGGLKPVLPQTASAVIAMGYHDEDLLLVEPPSAEPRFRMLLSQRASLLKSLSRSLGPQQIVLDFDGPEGPLAQVMIAIIPLPIERPGWGALVIERDQEDTYSEAELDLCTEFAALATTAADEAAEAMQQRHQVQIDPESGAFRASMLDAQLARAQELSVQKRRPVGVLRVSIDRFDKLAPEAVPALVRSVADTIREEIDFGEAIVRRDPGEFVVLLAGRIVGEMRTLGERVCSEMRRHPLPGAEGPLTVSVGVAQMLPGERSPLPCLERAEAALVKAQSYGGNMAQMIATANTGPNPLPGQGPHT